jgi:hypothetical protein
MLYHAQSPDIPVALPSKRPVSERRSNDIFLSLSCLDSEGGLVTVRTCTALENISSTACDVRNNFEEMEEKFNLQFCGVCSDELCNASVTSEISSTLLVLLISFATLIRLH